MANFNNCDLRVKECSKSGDENAVWDKNVSPIIQANPGLNQSLISNKNHPKAESFRNNLETNNSKSKNFIRSSSSSVSSINNTATKPTIGSLSKNSISRISIAKVFPRNNINIIKDNINENEICSKENQSLFQFVKGSLAKNRKNSINVDSCETKNNKKITVQSHNSSRNRENVEYVNAKPSDNHNFINNSKKKLISIESMTIMKIFLVILLVQFIPTTTQQQQQFKLNNINNSVAYSPSLKFNNRISYKDSNGVNSFNNNSSANNGKLIRITGDIILGGIFPMHEHLSENRDYPCGAIKEEKGIQRFEAMLFAIDRINNDATILKNITLGTVVIDSCSSDTYALEQSMEFVRYYMNQVS